MSNATHQSIPHGLPATGTRWWLDRPSLASADLIEIVVVGVLHLDREPGTLPLVCFRAVSDPATLVGMPLMEWRALASKVRDASMSRIVTPPLVATAAIPYVPGVGSRWRNCSFGVVEVIAVAGPRKSPTVVAREASGYVRTIPIADWHQVIDREGVAARRFDPLPEGR